MILMKKMTDSNIAILITAAGSSTRMGGGIKKEYLPFKNGTVLSSCAKTFLKALSNFKISSFIVTCPEGGEKACENALFSDKEFCGLFSDNFSSLKIQFVTGGATRQSSVYNALAFIRKNAPETDFVLIHDGARPFVSENIITSVIQEGLKYGASVPGVVPTDTQKEIDENGFIKRHLVRSQLRGVQTPQGFVFNKIFEAHTKASQLDFEFTDDTEIWGQFVGEVKVVDGEPQNIKITYPGDLTKI